MHLYFYDTNFTSRSQQRTAMCSIYGVGAPKRRTWRAYAIWNQSKRDIYPGTISGKMHLNVPNLDSLIEDVNHIETFLRENGTLFENQHMLLFAPLFQKQSILRGWHNCPTNDAVVSDGTSKHLPPELVGKYCFPD